jgi:hypothetical protein
VYLVGLYTHWEFTLKVQEN